MTRRMSGRAVFLLAAVLMAGCGGGAGDNGGGGGGGTGGGGGGGSGTDGDNGGGTAPSAPTALQVDVEIERTTSDVDGTVKIEWYVSIERDGVGINNAVVTVNGRNVPRQIGFIDGYYDLVSFGSTSQPLTGEATYTPGVSYTVEVAVDGVTYTDTLTAPGGITLADDGSSASWSVPALYGTVDVRHRFGSGTWGVPSARPTHIASPQVAPASAYPTSGDYVFNTWLQNYRWPAGARAGNGYFSTLMGTNTSFGIVDFRERLITKP